MCPVRHPAARAVVDQQGLQNDGRVRQNSRLLWGASPGVRRPFLAPWTYQSSRGPSSWRHSLPRKKHDLLLPTHNFHSAQCCAFPRALCDRQAQALAQPRLVYPLRLRSYEHLLPEDDPGLGVLAEPRFILTKNWHALYLIISILKRGNRHVTVFFLKTGGGRTHGGQFRSIARSDFG